MGEDSGRGWSSHVRYVYGVFSEEADSRRQDSKKQRLCLTQARVREGVRRANLATEEETQEGPGWQGRGWPRVGGAEVLSSPALIPVPQKPGDFSNELGSA